MTDQEQTSPDGSEQHWLRLAQDARDQAAQLSDPYSKRTLLLIAQRYATLAERVRRRSEGPDTSALPETRSFTRSGR